MNHRPMPARRPLLGILAPSIPVVLLPSILAVLALPAILALLVLPAVLGLAPTARAAATATPGRWSWPLDGQPSVVRGFEVPSEPWLAGHRGVDLRASPGEAVRAAGAGEVTFAGWVGGVPSVAVTHDDGLRTTYQPVLAVVTTGDVVARGAILGRVSAGGSHCPPLACLHWGLRRGSSYLDPLSLVGGHVQVRLLPVWSNPGAPPWVDPAARLKDRPPTALPAAHLAAQGTPSRGPSHLARVGALNRARADGWAEVVV
jgi:murein DD-endopeptidase MepM/ murein hydrolase activator NlpD